MGRAVVNGRTALLVAATLAGAGFVTCGGFVALFGAGAVLGAMEFEAELTPEREATLLTAADLLGPDAVDPALEKRQAIRHYDGSLEIVYDYEAEGVYVHSSAQVDRSGSDALLTYAALATGERIGLAGNADVERVDVPDAWRWGDQSRLSEWRYAGKPVGFGFVGLHGRHTWYGVVVGVTATPDQAREVLTPKLDALNAL